MARGTFEKNEQIQKHIFIPKIIEHSTNFLLIEFPWWNLSLNLTALQQELKENGIQNQNN